MTRKTERIGTKREVCACGAGQFIIETYEYENPYPKDRRWDVARIDCVKCDKTHEAVDGRIAAKRTS